MAARPIDCIEEFPKDGRLWWVRWVDRYHVPKGGTATPGVEVLLSPLDLALADLRKADPHNIATTQCTNKALLQAPIPVFTGFIPRLALGSIFLNGIEVASIPLEKALFDISEFSITVQNIQDELPSKPSWWKYPYRVINKSDYHLGDFPDAKKSQAIVVTSERAVIVIPCHEIFRTMYAPHSDMARALTSGPWEFTKAHVVNPEGTGQRADGLWQITLRPRIKNDFGTHLANLCISEIGRAAANHIYTGLMKETSPGYLAAPIPFNPTRLRFEARGLWLKGEPRKFLALQIVAIDWPSFPPIAPFRDNDGTTGQDQTLVDRNKPYGPSIPFQIVEDNTVITANSQEDPLASSNVTTFTIPSVTWGNCPQRVHEKKKESFIYKGLPRSKDETELDGVSPGTAWEGDSNSGMGAYSAESRQKRDVNQRFTEVTMMFERLLSSGEIIGWSIVPHPTRPILHAGALPLWHFPVRAKDTKKLLPFGFINRKEKQLRGALVCKVELRGDTIYWLEIEVERGKGGYKALVYTTPKEDFNSTTSRLLEIAALNQGKWLPREELVQFAHVSTAETWIHSFVDRQKMSNGGRLNEDRALVAISTAAKANTLATNSLNPKAALSSLPRKMIR